MNAAQYQKRTQSARAEAPSAPLVELTDIHKHYQQGTSTVRALDGVSLTIEAGELVAIMGQSGSGKSTLMNIIGCLDRPSSGTYRVAGIDVETLTSDQLAALRCRTFGFVFQRFNLLPAITASENVEIPAAYAGRSKRDRMERAKKLLARLGLGERWHHKPTELSGGQQQRVSIARALMNEAPVVLADEPTGALDTRSGEEVLALLKELHAEGHTVIIITHNPEIAEHAERVIRIADGKIQSDERKPGAQATKQNFQIDLNTRNHWLPDLVEAGKMALNSMRVNLFRTALTLLGVVIGVAAVVAMLGIGDGSKQQVLERISSMGTNLLVVRPGARRVRATGDIATLVEEDAKAISELPAVTVVSPERQSRATVRFGNTDYQTVILGAWPGYAQARDWPVAQGSFISDDDVKGYAPVVVLGQTVVNALFPDGENPVGRYLLVRNVPFEIVGVLSARGATPWGQDQDDVVVMPLSTGYMRVFGKRYLQSITVLVANADEIKQTEADIEKLVTERHRGVMDFSIRNTASILEAAIATQETLTLLLASVAAISLLVGGIGVMNIMLVSVTERTREIGVRMATGARQGNILLQFNTEALVVCGIGGLIGVALGIVVALVVQSFGVSVVLSPLPAILAFSCAFLTGLLFGYLPARNAARMDPVVALSYE
ncbi:MAG: MacB family efflux pump subunit [Xanthobacteraceae bacterium]|nr:MacB family efflux pump subunit [Xanthobacteraceae bacterium]QYK45567.1 MAG: MacB family efflux pump subunit [Xanthobacteraceae bacterium]